MCGGLAFFFRTNLDLKTGDRIIMPVINSPVSTREFMLTDSGVAFPHLRAITTVSARSPPGPMTDVLLYTYTMLNVSLLYHMEVIFFEWEAYCVLSSGSLKQSRGQIAHLRCDPLLAGGLSFRVNRSLAFLKSSQVSPL